jgi:hypothetical protein
VGAIGTFKLLAIGIIASALLSRSALLFFSKRTLCSLLQVIGAASLMLVVLAHVAESFRLFPAMGWGQPHSAGHYLDFFSALLSVAFFPTGYFLHRIANAKRSLTHAANASGLIP